MIAYKGFTNDIWSQFGDGKEKTCRFKVGDTKKVKESKTAKSGFHCCENPFECLAYYPMNGQNRFFKVEAAGDIDEDGYERIACTKITILEELTPIKFAMEGIKYMIQHPQRRNWEQEMESVQVKKDEAKTDKEGYIAIARGKRPRVKGTKGSIVGLLVDKDGEITNAKLLVVDEKYKDKWLQLTEERKVKVIEES